MDVHALQDGRHALEPHAGVDRGLGQVDAVAGPALLVLHEHEVPELQEAVAVLRPALPGGPPAILSPWSKKISEQGPHGPVSPADQKLSRRGDADDLVVGEARHLLPDAVGVLVVVVDGDEQALGIEAEVLGDELPRQRDRPLLEVVAEGEVAEHLEEGVMPGGVADVVEVVVLAAGAHAFLRGGGARVGARLLAGEDVLELHHAGGREHQGRVVARHQRRGRHDLVAVLGEEVEKRRADLIDAGHDAATRAPAHRARAAGLCTEIRRRRRSSRRGPALSTNARAGVPESASASIRTHGAHTLRASCPGVRIPASPTPE